MALPDTFKLVPGTPKVFANSGEYSPTDAGQPSTIDADIDLQNVGISGACRIELFFDFLSTHTFSGIESQAHRHIQRNRRATPCAEQP